MDTVTRNVNKTSEKKIGASSELRWRDSLIHRLISLKDRNVWVVKNVETDEFFFFEIDEYKILENLTVGQSSSSRDERPPTELGRDEINDFVVSAIRVGLIIPKNPAATLPRQLEPLNPSPPWWTHPWAIRIPVLSFTEPRQQTYCHHNYFLHFITAWIVAACLIAAVHFESLIADISSATTRLWSGGGSGLLIMFCVAVVTAKVCHELGHLLACRWFGGRCREIGVLLLMGIPCLYCDVSDTWLMPRRRDRILVSAAGVIAEWMIASLAMFVWATTRVSIAHDFAAIMIVVTSVGTLVININPLMRYDGYYILSDWVGIPNLAAESKHAWNRLMRGSSSGTSDFSKSTFRRLAIYFVISILYRCMVFTAIGVLVFQWLSAHVGVGAAIPVISLVGWSILRPKSSETIAPSEVSNKNVFAWNRPRPFATSLAVILVVFVVIVPLPRSTRVGCIVEAGNERELFVTSVGCIRFPDSAPENLIAEIDDWQLKLQAEVAEGRVAEIEAELNANRIESTELPQLAAMSLILSKRLEAAKQQHAVLSRRVADLKIIADLGQVVFPPTLRKRDEIQRQQDRWTWTGTPLDTSNEGAIMNVNTLLATTGHPTHRLARLYVPQNAIESVDLGQPVRFGFPGYPLSSINGRVVSVSKSPVEAPPTEIIASHWVTIDLTTPQSQTPQTPHYEVIAEIETMSQVLPIRMIGPARIELPAASLFDQLRSWISQQI